jgi:predicted transcriptional regulator
MPKSKIREITIKESKGAFSIFKKTGISKEDYDFSGVLALRQLLSNEKARILNVIKAKNPKSIYELAKILNRGFKSVNDDIKLLSRFGFIELIEEKTKNRARLKPVVVVDKVTINVVL